MRSSAPLQKAKQPGLTLPATRREAERARKACGERCAMEADGTYEPGFVGIRFCQEW